MFGFITFLFIYFALYLSFLILVYEILNEFENKYLQIKSNKEDFDDESIHKNLSKIGLYLLLIFIFLSINFFLFWKPFNFYKEKFYIKYSFNLNICFVLGFFSLYPKKLEDNLKKKFLTFQNAAFFFGNYLIINYLYNNLII